MSKFVTKPGDVIIIRKKDKNIVKHLPGQHDQQSHAGGRVVISSQFQQEIDPGFKAGGSGVTRDESWAVAGYRSSGYQDINMHLRGQEPKLNTDETKQIESQIQLLDQAIAKAPGAPEEFISYRGLQAVYAERIYSLEPGQTFTDLGYSSTTMKHITAQNFGYWAKESTVVEITNPVGTKGIMMQGFFGPDADIDKEAEWLLPRKTTFKVLSKERKDGVRTIKVRVENE